MTTSNTTHHPWPMQKALLVQERIKTLNKTLAIFETGYGPSGLPHMGTVAEVTRTKMIKKAYDSLNCTPSILIAIVDDMDGLRKVPGNVPNSEMLKANLDKPLYLVPDPYEEYDSFATQNTHRLEKFLNNLNHQTKLISDPHNPDEFQDTQSILILRSSLLYKSGKFNSALIDMLKHSDSVLAIMKEHLRSERFESYSHFLPTSPVTGKVLQVSVDEYKSSSITFKAEDNQIYELPVTDGYCKLQWKPDFGMRWHALKVDFEMYGKDLISTGEVAEQICTLLGSTPPITMVYEHFLAESGGKISKSKGNETVTVDHWQRYTPTGTFEHFLFNNPQRAKRMRMIDIPTYVEAFLTDLHKPHDTSNPIYYIEHKISPPNISYKLAFSLACALHFSTVDLLLQYMNITTPSDQQIVTTAFTYYEEQIKSTLIIEKIPKSMHHAVHELINLLTITSQIPNPNQSTLTPSNPNQSTSKIPTTLTHDFPHDLASQFQHCFFTIAKTHNLDTSTWFKALYKALIGTEQGPKLGNFCTIFGIQNVIQKLQYSITE